IEDVYLLKNPQDDHERAALNTLARAWLAHFATLSTWKDDLVSAGFRVMATDELSEVMKVWLISLIDVAHSHSTPPQPETELTGWMTGLSLTADGIVGYVRLLAAKN